MRGLLHDIYSYSRLNHPFKPNPCYGFHSNNTVITPVVDLEFILFELEGATLKKILNTY